MDVTSPGRGWSSIISAASACQLVPPVAVFRPEPEDEMRIFGSIVEIVLLLLGAVWILQGANVLAGSVMSGQTQWLYIGLVVVLVGLVVLWWFNLRGRQR